MCSDKTFLFDFSNGSITYTELLQDLNKTQTFPKYLKPQTFYECFKNIILASISLEEIVLLDSDFSEAEIENLTGFSALEMQSQVYEKKCQEIKSASQLIELVQNATENFKITLFTSGTTGTPKKVSHNIKSLTRFLKKSTLHEQSVWGFAYNPTHMAGIQVFLQALLNKNSIVKLFGLERTEIFNQIQNHNITHISATPTFYRLLLPVENTFNSVIRLTCGGEKFDSKTLAELTKMFPNAKITNVYASTEAGTLFASKEDLFVVKDAFANSVKIKNNELLLHKSLLGQSQQINLDNDWYNTSDLVEIISENPLSFKFIARKNEMINVGGYKVNPTEVEEVIRSIAQVKDVRVFGKSNSILGNIICAEIVANSQMTEKEIRDFLKTKLQQFKIPRLIKFTDKLQFTRTGKTSRK